MIFASLLPIAATATHLTRRLLARGVCRALDQLGYASLVEFPLANGRRADILALGKRGDLVDRRDQDFGGRFPCRPKMADLSRIRRSLLFCRAQVGFRSR